MSATTEMNKGRDLPFLRRMEQPSARCVRRPHRTGCRPPLRSYAGCRGPEFGSGQRISAAGYGGFSRFGPNDQASGRRRESRRCMDHLRGHAAGTNGPISTFGSQGATQGTRPPSEWLSRTRTSTRFSLSSQTRRAPLAYIAVQSYPATSFIRKPEGPVASPP